MKRDGTKVLVGLLLAVSTITSVFAQRQSVGNTQIIAGNWEGVWYRGMTSGRVNIVVRGSEGNIQFTNLENFGRSARLLIKMAFEDGIFQFRADGEQGGPLIATLSLNDAGTSMKGMGTFDGFPLRFELKRGPSQ